MIIDDMFPMLLEATWTNENRYVSVVLVLVVVVVLLLVCVSGVSVGGGVVYMC